MRVGPLLPLLIAGACAPLPPRPVEVATPRDELMALVPGPLQSLLAVDVAQLRGSPWAQPVLETAAPLEGRARRGFDEIGDVDRWLLANVRTAGSGTGTLELGRGRFNRGRVEASFRDRHPSAQERRFGRAAGLADAEAAVTFPLGGTVALGPIWAVQAAVRAAEPAGTGAPKAEPWLAQAVAALEETTRRGAAGDRPRAAVELWLRLDDSTRAELTALVGDAEGVDWIAARLTLAAEARAIAVARTRADGEAAALAMKLAQLLEALSARRSVRALGLGSVLERAQVQALGASVVVELAISPEEREQVSQRLAVLAAALRSRGEPAAAAP